jgi:peptidoglycan/LPS O-acetylase OafA/YrhL
LRDLTKLGEGRAIELDAIRGLAILLAVGSHINRYTGNAAMDLLLAPGILFGEAGVDIFFVLSGFLIGGLILREIDSTGGFRAGRFLVRRAFRLWPVLYLFLAMQLVRQAFPAGEYLPQVLLNVQNYFRTPLSHLWSLAVEEQFYFAAALALPFVIRRKLSARSLFLGLTALGIASGVARTAMILRGADLVAMQAETHYRLDVLIVGILLALIKLRRPQDYRRLQRHRGLAAAFAVAICAMLAALSPHGDRLRAALEYPLQAALGASLIIAADDIALGAAARRALRPLALMGLYSYSVYIWHVGVGRQARAYVEAQSGSGVLATLASYAAVIAVSVAITRLVERPMINIRDRVFPSYRSQSPRELADDAALAAPRAST